VIKFGGSNTPSATPAYVSVENLDISGARQENNFRDDGDAVVSYGKNAAGIFVESGAHLTIRNCRLHDNGNGLFIASGASGIPMRRFLAPGGSPGRVYNLLGQRESTAR